MKKKICFITTFLAVIMCACTICGCTPKAKTIWCDGLGGDKFQIEFSVANSSYNGDWASFSVKDEEAFSEYLKSNSEFQGMTQMSDAEEEVYLFRHNGQNYFCQKAGSDGRYTLSACRFEDNAENVCFAFPPVSFDSYLYEGEKEIPIIRSWDYFASYYSALGNDVTVNGEEKTISLKVYQKGYDTTCGTVLLQFKDGTISYQITLDEGAE